MYEEAKNSGNGKGESRKLANPLFKSIEDKNDEDVFNGFTNIAIIGLIVSFIIGFGIGIAYMLIHI